MIRRAFTYVFSVVRGFIRTAEHEEAALRFLASNNAETARAAVYAIEEIERAHKDPGPHGVGARIAISSIEIDVLKTIAQDTVGPVYVSTTPIGDA